MEWLIRNKGGSAKAHVWIDGDIGKDTACRMWSTGGLRRDRYRVLDQRGLHQICWNCQNVLGVPLEGRNDESAERFLRERFPDEKT